MAIYKGETQQKYVYSFFIRNTIQEAALNELFELFDCRLEVCYTEDNFNSFRSSLLKRGIELKEIERVPYKKWEFVP